MALMLIPTRGVFTMATWLKLIQRAERADSLGMAGGLGIDSILPPRDWKRPLLMYKPARALRVRIYCTATLVLSA